MERISKLLPTQAKNIYQLLLQRPMTAKEIGLQLQIYPNVVYRSVHRLSQLGCVQQIGQYPATFSSQSPPEAARAYTAQMEALFLKTFDHQKFRDGQNLNKELMNLSFLQGRDEFIQRSTQDIQQAQKSVELIVSGLEVPAETILTNKQAVDRGVTIRVLVQQSSKRAMLLRWKQLGVKIKSYPTIEARIVVIDSKIAYIGSYNPLKQTEAKTVRFVYPPIAKLFHEVFIQKWKTAKTL